MSLFLYVYDIPYCKPILSLAIHEVTDNKEYG